MKNFINFLTKSTLAILAIFGISAAANAQCAAGEVEVFIDITTDAWGYEVYWELVPAGDTCGSPNAVASGGNTNVGCSPIGSNQSTATSADPGVLPNSSTTQVGPFCLTEGQDYTLIMHDDWGDGGSTFASGSQGFSTTTSGATETFTFTATAQSPYDVALGVTSAVATGWTREYGRVIADKYHPLSQMSTSETVMAITAKNNGINATSNAYARLNIDLLDAGTGNYNNVYTDTLQFGTIAPDSIAYGSKVISDDTWWQEGFFRYQYISYQDSVDGKPNNDTITDFFTITDKLWSKVDLAGDGAPFGDNIYLPSVDPGGYITKMEWGTVYFIPNGLGYTLDTMVVRLFEIVSGTSGFNAAYTAKISKIVDDGSGAFEIENDLQLAALQSDTVTLTATSAAVTRIVTGFININTGLADFQFEDNELYYVSIDQNNQTAPGLNDGTTRNALAMYGQVINHDDFVFSDSVVGFPFYNPLIIEEFDGAAIAQSAFEYGWTGGPEPSFMFNMESLPNAIPNFESEELAGVNLFPNPTKESFTVELNLDNAKEVKLILTDVTGRVIKMEFANNVSQESRTYNISNLPAGVYMMSVVADGVRTTKRVVKQ
jgi:hypothetical protein